jgi:SAM-dependent methyltransferase
MTASISRDHFEKLYAANPDPWGFTTSAYEAGKYAATIDALPRLRFRSGLEVGCSFGVLSRALAERCDQLLAIDLAQSVVERARASMPEVSNIRFDRATIPQEWPEGMFDLIVFSEVLYFLNDADLNQTASLAARGLDRDGIVVMVNWLGDTSAPHTGDEAAGAFIRAMQPHARPILQTRADRYRLDILAR